MNFDDVVDFLVALLLQWERDSMTNIRFGHLNLVDLAGSERYVK